MQLREPEMSRSAIAVALSALVLPGAGQIYLKHIGRGLALAGVSLVCVWIIMARLVRLTSDIWVQLESGTASPEAIEIANLFSQASGSTDSTLVWAATWILLICWVVGIADAYRLAQLEMPRKNVHPTMKK